MALTDIVLNPGPPVVAERVPDVDDEPNCMTEPAAPVPASSVTVDAPAVDTHIKEPATALVTAKSLEYIFLRTLVLRALIANRQSSVTPFCALQNISWPGASQYI